MRHLFPGLVILLLFSGACNRSKVPTEGTVNAHVVEYKVNYLDSKAGSIPTSILPSKMTLVFAEHFALNRIDGFLGQFSLAYIANLKTRSVTTMLKIFDKKYYYQGKPDELPCGIYEIHGLTIEETGNTKEISGYTANEMIARINNDSILYLYSAQLDHIKNPNITTPYRKVEGVLLEFYTTLSIMQMKFSASRIYFKEIDWSLFNIPDDYKQISREEMEKGIRELFK